MRGDLLQCFGRAVSLVHPSFTCIPNTRAPLLSLPLTYQPCSWVAEGQAPAACLDRALCGLLALAALGGEVDPLEGRGGGHTPPPLPSSMVNLQALAAASHLACDWAWRQSTAALPEPPSGILAAGTGGRPCPVNPHHCRLWLLPPILLLTLLLPGGSSAQQGRVRCVCPALQGLWISCWAC